MKNSILFLSGVIALFLLISCSSADIDKSPEKKTPEKKTPDNNAVVPSSGKAVISRYECGTNSPEGALVTVNTPRTKMAAGVPATGITKTIKANVTAEGTYSVSTIPANGVTFESSGKFETTGIRDVILTAKGTPVEVGELDLVLDATPPCVFPITIDKNPGSNGTAVVSRYDCTTVSVKKLVVGVATNVTQTIKAVVDIKGSYDISTTTVNGITFAGKGVFPTAGTQTIQLTASGTPLETGNSVFALKLPATIPACSFSREIITLDSVVPDSASAVCDGSVETEIVDVLSDAGTTWMDRNLGATSAATSANDNQAYGCLFQWGRCNDGHASINWVSAARGEAVNGTTTILSVGDKPGNSKFITSSTKPYDWRSAKNDGLWQGVNGINNPCPSGYRIPTDSELSDVAQTNLTIDGVKNINNNSIENMDKAYRSNLKFVAAGSRRADGTFTGVGLIGKYWTSSPPGPTEGEPTDMNAYYFTDTKADISYRNSRAAGLSVRCIKNKKDE